MASLLCLESSLPNTTLSNIIKITVFTFKIKKKKNKEDIFTSFKSGVDTVQHRNTKKHSDLARI